MTLPKDLDILRPLPSSVKPWVSTLVVRRAAARRQAKSAARCETSRDAGRCLRDKDRLRPPKPRILLDHRGMAHARVKPDIENVFFAAKLAAAAVRAFEIGRNEFVRRPNEPGIRTFLLENRRDVITKLSG